MLLTFTALPEGVISFVVSNHPKMMKKSQSLSFLRMSEKTVEVCGFKDCRRAGGGARLQKLVTEVSFIFIFMEFNVN